MTDNVYCLVKIIEKDERVIAAVQFEIKLFDFFLRSKQLTDYIYTDIYCKLSKCIGQTPCLYEHYIVIFKHLSCTKSFWKIFHVGSGKVLDVFVSKRAGTLVLI